MPLSQEGVDQSKFSLLPDEKIVMEGRFTYYYKFNNLLKTGTTYLTQFRLVFCNNHGILFPIIAAALGGFLIALTGFKSELWFFVIYVVAYAICLARKPTKITFQIPITEIKSITRKKYGLGSKYTILTAAGEQYIVQFTGEAPWKNAITSLGINIDTLTKGEKPSAGERGAAAAPVTAGPAGPETPAASTPGFAEKALSRKTDWAPVVILIAVMVMALGAGVYFWRSHQPALPTKQEVIRALEKLLAKTGIPKREAKRAVEHLKPATQPSAKAYYKQGVQAKEIPQKISFYTKAIELNPNYALAYYGRGNAYYQIKDYAKALKDYDRAIELAPKFSYCYNNRGIIYYNKKQYEKALSDYNKAISLKSNNQNAYYNRGRLYFKLKDYNKALNDFNQAITLKPDYAFAYFMRALLYYQMKNFEQARHDYNKAKSLNPKLPDFPIKNRK